MTESKTRAWQPAGQGRARQHRRVLTIAAAGAAAAATVLAMLPATAQSAASDSTGNATATDSTASVRPLSTAQASKLSVGDKQPVIVLLKNQHPELPATAGGSGPRSRTTASDQQPLINEAKQTGATDIKPFSVLNGFAAKLTPAEQRHMAADPGVRSVVPDLPIKLAQPKTQAGTAKPALTPKVPAGVCPSDPSKPQLEPEALQTTNTAFADPSKPSAQKLATGKGVKVAFIADGLDVNNPDLIRATGGRVIVDYRDFSGEGTLLGGDAREAFGDASSIAAQGRQSYDLSTFANPAAPLPKGCNIRVLGVAPGASIVALKAIASNGFGSTSSVVQSIDYAVTTDHVNVINESLGANPYPDNNNDPFTLANDAAVAAGVTVVASDGDAGVTNTIGSPASDPKIISAGASTTWRLDASTVVGALPGFKGGWNNDNVSAISSAGVTQVGAKTIDMEAPGDEGWALCSTKYRAYTGCADNNGNPSPIQQFGGTSEAAPLISGAAALVIDAYGKTHGGAKPSPALVKQILTSTATDERDPADRQGNGVLNSLAAVQAAMSIHDGNGSPTAQGSGLIFDQNQLTSTVDPNTDQGFDVHVTNVGSAAQTINARGRALSTKVSDESGSVHLDGTGGQTFVDAYGYTRSYVTHTFTVPAGADHLDASIANQPKGPNPVRFWLLDPDGKLAGYTWPQGIAGFGHADVHSPKPGTWTAVIYVKQASNSFAGDVHYDFATTGWANAGSVSPSSLTLQPGQSGTVHVTEHSSDSAGDAISALELTSNSGKRYALPIVLRSLVKINGSEGDFSGTLTGGNGRPGGPAQTNSYYFDVPSGQRDLDVDLTLHGSPNQTVSGYLVSPDGQILSQGNNVTATSNGSPTAYGSALQGYVSNPAPGRWRYTVAVANPVSGNDLSQQVTGRVRLNAVDVKADGVPAGQGTVLPAGKPTTVTVHVHNTGSAAGQFFVDPRTSAVQTMSLAPLGPASGVKLGPTASTPFLVPPQTTTFTGSTKGTVPVTSDIYESTGAPEILAQPSSGTASASTTSAEVGQGEWYVEADPIGPFSGSVNGTADMSATAVAPGFDDTVTSTTGDVWLASTQASPPAPKPLTLAPGATGDITVTITPTAKTGTIVSGTLYVDDFSSFATSGDELSAIPYSYQVG